MKIQKYITFSLLFVSSYCNSSIEYIASSMLRDGIVYSTYKGRDFPLVVHVITMPLCNVNLGLVLAQGQREEVSSIAQRSGAFIAVNGCNYRRGGRFNGNRVNLLYHGNCVHSDLGLVRGSLAWNNEKKSARITSVIPKSSLTINGISSPVDSVNQPRGTGKAALYTDKADVALLGYNPGLHVVINERNKVEDVTDAIPSVILEGWYVYQIDGASIGIKRGDVASVQFSCRASDGTELMRDYDFIIGGAGLLISDGEIVSMGLYDEFSQGGPIEHCHDEIAADFNTTSMQEWLIEQRHPRTALGITQANELCIVVVDGRQQASVGMSLHELAQFMKELCCVYALNIGGGGCTTLFVDGKVINCPSAGEERPVSEAFCIF